MTTENQSKHEAKNWKAFLAHESVEYFINFAFLAVFLVSFAWYRRLVLAAYHIQYLHYWMPLIEAAILAKVIMLGDALRIGRRFRDKPLAVITVYRSVVFSLFVVLFTLVEHILEAMLHGKPAAEGIAEILRKGFYEDLASCLVIFAAFLPFFAMKEIERVFGADKVRKLFFFAKVDESASAASNNG